MSQFFIDFHSHPTLRAINSPPINIPKNIWDKTFNNFNPNSSVSRWARMQTREIAKESQSNFYAYAENNFRVVFDSLYPVEKGWFKFRKMPGFLVGDRMREELMQVGSGVERERLNYLMNKESYFEELCESYEFLKQGQGPSPDGKYKYKLVTNYKELMRVLQKEPDTMAIVVNIEGGHSLECGSPLSITLKSDDHKKVLTDNISILKSWEHPPFFITLAHHFYNQLCGQARSFHSPMNFFFNQKFGINRGMTELGWHVIQELLSNKNGRRILIDIKHMSIRSRKEFYYFIVNHNKMFPNEKIPIICSHSGVNGVETMDETISRKDNRKKFKRSYFNNWSINLSNEEIRIIHDSGGMIGIMMDKGLLGSKDTMIFIRSIPDPEIKKSLFMKLILDNIFTIVKAVGKMSGWDIITLGTDYDGLIKHIDGYENVTKIPQLKNDLIHFLYSTRYLKAWWFGMSPEEIMDKIFTNNLINFLKVNFK